LRLTEKEAAILQYLHRAEQQPGGQETLLKHVWGYNANVTTHARDAHLSSASEDREQSGRSAASRTEGGGYKLVASGASGASG
jgi:DNA-binding response OmpR family regulator